MSFLPPGENIIETKKCRISGKDFFVTDKDLEFYDKISPIFGGKKYSIPSPTLCPDERQRRRLAFRNERKLYHRKCDKTGNQIISIYSSDKPYKVYDQKVWWSDDWNPFEYGRSFDFEKGFFEQFRQLQFQVPRVNLFAKNCENAEFTNHTDHIKNCYLCVDTADSENIYYSKWIISCHDIFDCYQVQNCHHCYECQYCMRTSNSSFCVLCDDSSDCIFSYGLQNCHDCLFCSYLQNKQYCIMNQQYSPEEFEKRKKGLVMESPQQLRKLITVYRDYMLRCPREHLIVNNSEGVFGDFISHTRNAFCCFELSNCDNMRYCFEDIGIKDSYDVYESGFECEQQYECHASNRVKFSSFCSLGYDNNFLYYTELCNNSNHCFGSIGLKRAHHSILNTSYSVQEYETLCGKIIDHMKSTGEWGEFFPHHLSPFGYNETVAQEYFPMTEEAVKEKGWNWKPDEEMSSYHGPYYTPLSIKEYDERVVGYDTAQKNIDAVLSGIIQCEITGKPFKVIKQELAFYIENGIPIPTKHPDVRHLERLKMRNPRTLYTRTCHKCHREIVTTYSPERPERVVCEECYRKLVY